MSILRCKNYICRYNLKMTDNYEHKGLRKKLLETIKEKGITNSDVLKAIEEVPRHLFIDNTLYRMAYEDKAMRIGQGQTISQPYTVARQSELLEIKKFDKVLEVGTGSGYQAAILAAMGARVYTVERIKSLFLDSQKLLNRLGYTIKFSFGDGYAGWPAFAPYDKIIVTAGAPEIPTELFNQLKVGGRMVIPIDKNNYQEMLLIEKSGEGPDDMIVSKKGTFQFVPMLKGKKL